MDLVVVLIVVVATLAALGVYIYLSARATAKERAREAASPLPIPKVTTLRARTVVADVKPAVKPARPVAAPVIDVTPTPTPPPTPAPTAAPLFDLELEPIVVSPPVEVRWSRRFDTRSGVLDEMARLRLIGDLGVIAKEWCVPLLCQAYEEEQRPGHRQAALTALAACRSRTAQTTFRRALASTDPTERAIATDALADLEPPPQVKQRRTVERH
jgi:hypothetical protein